MSRLGANIIFGLAAFALLGTGGWLVARRSVAAEITTAKSDTESELTRLRAENRELRRSLLAKPVATAPASTPTVTPPPVNLGVQRAKLIADMSRQGLLGKTAWPAPNRNSLAAAMTDIADFFDLNSAEAAALQEAAEAGRKEFSDVLVSHALVTRSGSMVTITANDNPEVHAAFDRMLAAMGGVLGPERYGYFESMGAKDAVAKLFDQWGLNGTRIMVSHSATIPDEFYPSRSGGQGRPRGDPSGRVLYNYTRSKPGQGGSGGGGTDSIEHLGPNIGPLNALVPADL